MRDIGADTLNAASQRVVVGRLFTQITGRSFADGTIQTAYFWNDIDNVSAPVTDGETRLVVTNDYIGAATLLKIGDIQLTSDVTIRTVDVTFSQLNEAVLIAVRGADLKRGKAQVHLGLFDPLTRALVEPATPIFVGAVDKSKITTPQEGNDGSIVLSLSSHTQELTRYNPDTRSHNSQLRRNAGDDFLIDAAVVGDRPIWWGTVRGKLGPAAKTSTAAIAIQQQFG